MRRIAVFGLIVVALATSWGSALGGEPAPGDTVAVWGRVFLDLNEDGVCDSTETGVPGIAVSNSQTVFLTDSEGAFSTIVNRAMSKFVWITKPRGKGATTAFYDRIDPAATTDTMYFGLRDDPASQAGPFTFAHVTDSEVLDMGQRDNLAADLQEIAASVPSPSFIVSTGDLVGRGELRYLFGYYRDATRSQPVPVWNVYGNHDREDGAPDVRAAYEDSLGPSYYSFDHSDIHVVVLNSMDPPPSQNAWLASDLALVAPGTRIIVCRHDAPTHAQLDEYADLGVKMVMCGHWHGDRILTYRGVEVVNTPPVSFPGLDRSPRGFRLIHVDEDSIRSEIRWGGFSQHSVVISPADGNQHVKGFIPLLVNAYDSSRPMESVTVTIEGPEGSSDPIPLSRLSEWTWSGTWDATDLPNGYYQASASLVDVNGNSASAGSEFWIIDGVGPHVVASTDWDFFHGDIRRTGASDDVITLPLALAWVAPAGGMVGLSSPVVHGGVVYVGTGRSAAPDEAGVTAIDAATGARLWRTVTSSSVKNTVAATENGVYATTANGILHAFDRLTGETTWRVALGDTAVRWETSSPIVADGDVYAGRLTSFSRCTESGGALQSLLHVGNDHVPNDYPAPAITDDHVYVAGSWGVFALHKNSGLVDWYRLALTLGMAVDDSVVYVVEGNPSGHLYLTARDAADASLIWRSSVDLHYSISTPAISDSLVVVGSVPGQVCAFERETGALRWTFDTGSPITRTRPYWRYDGDVVSSPVISGSNVFVGGSDGFVYALDLETGSVVWRYAIGAPMRASPAVSGNTVFVSTDDGCVYALAPAIYGPTSGGEPPTPPPAQSLTIRCPSPLRAGDRIRFGGGRWPDAKGDLLLVDVRGRLVRRLFSGPLGSSVHEFAWDGRDGSGALVGSGIYFATLRTNHGTVNLKIVMAR